MTSRQMLERLQEVLSEYNPLEPLDFPALYRIKGAMDNAIWDALHDPKTPCPHTGTHWTGQSGEICGTCGRRMEKVHERRTETAEAS